MRERPMKALVSQTHCWGSIAASLSGWKDDERIYAEDVGAGCAGKKTGWRRKQAGCPRQIPARGDGEHKRGRAGSYNNCCKQPLTAIARVAQRRMLVGDRNVHQQSEGEQAVSRTGHRDRFVPAGRIRPLSELQITNSVPHPIAVRTKLSLSLPSPLPPCSVLLPSAPS